MTDIKHYAYRVVWSVEDGEFVATVAEFPSLSWLHTDQAKALRGLVDLVADLKANGDPVLSPSRAAILRQVLRPRFRVPSPPTGTLPCPGWSQLEQARQRPTSTRLTPSFAT